MNGKMLKPNLFSYATSELSQDAVLCWLLDWANPEFQKIDPLLHAVGTRFIKTIFDKCEKVLPQIAGIKVKNQYKKIDVYAIVTPFGENENPFAVIIEDKVHTNDHSDQLQRYRQAISSEGVEESRILCIYLKTGNQSDLASVKAAGYKCIDREELIDVLDPKQEERSPDSIYNDFCNYLNDLDASYKAYRLNPVDKWEWPQWEGFLMALHEKIMREDKQAEWGYVPNASGGFVGLWWHFIGIFDPEDPLDTGIRLYLQFEMNKFCFKASLGSDVKFWRKRKEDFHSAIVKAGQKILGTDEIAKPQWMRIGTSSTLAIWKNFLPDPLRMKSEQSEGLSVCTSANGFIDMDKVEANIAIAEEILDSVADILFQNGYARPLI